MLWIIVPATLLWGGVRGSPTLLVFGDSLSGDGNGTKRLYDQYLAGQDVPLDPWPLPPKSPPYFNGRFSNGPVRAEGAAAQLGLPLTDFAVGGARSGAGSTGYLDGNATTRNDTVVEYSIPIPSLLDQVDIFSAGSNPGAHIAVLWIGENDYLTGDVTPPAVIDAHRRATGTLHRKGIRRFVFMTSIPPFTLPPYVKDLNSTFSEHNRLLQRFVSDLHLPDAEAYVFDMAAAYANISGNAKSLGFTAGEKPCLDRSSGSSEDGSDPELQACYNPGAHLLWDGYHPTAAVHKILGDRFADYVRSLRRGFVQSSRGPAA